MMVQTRRFYEKLYLDPDYKGGFDPQKDPGSILRFKLIIQFLEKYGVRLKRSSKVLDLGCSRGDFLNFLPVEKENKYGVDISRAAIESVKEKGLNGCCLNVEQDRLPFKDNFFDFIFIMEVLEHLFSVDLVVCETKRVLKPGGFLIVTVPNEILRFDKLIKLLVFREPPFYETFSPYCTSHIRFFTKKKLTSFLTGEGFKVVTVGGIPLSYKGKRLPFGAFLANVFTDFLAHYIAIAKNTK